MGAMVIFPPPQGPLSREHSGRQKQQGLPYQRADRFMERQAEAIAAQGQYQLLTLLQRSELATV